MKTTKQFIALTLALLFVVTAFGGTAFAAATSKSLKLGTWYKAFRMGESASATVYKIKFTEDKIVTLKWKGLESGSFLTPTFTKTFPNWLSDNLRRNEFDPDEWSYYLTAASGTKNFIISAGTYYLYVPEDSDSPKEDRMNAAPLSQFCITAKTLGQQPTDYTPSRAITLQADKRTFIRQLPLEAHYCWYKITLPKRQVLTIIRDSYLPISIFSAKDFWMIYNSENARQYKSDFKTTRGKIISKTKLDKGDYYIRVYPFLDGVCFFANDVWAFKWK